MVNRQSEKRSCPISGSTKQ